MAGSPPCPFCNLPVERALWSTSHVLAIRDRYPVSPGHTLIITRRHVETYFDATAEEQAAIWGAVERAKRELDAELDPKPDGYNVGFNAGDAAGQTVMHVHVHVIPRYRGDMADPRGGVRGVIPAAQKYGDAEDSTRDLQRVLEGGERDALLADILPALDRATRVDLAIAFVLDGGVKLLARRLRDVLGRSRSRVRILTGTYHDVTEPEALKRLLDLPLQARVHEVGSTLELRAYRVRHFGHDSFHPKAWLTVGDAVCRAWVGSSNMSATALVSGLEWNYRIVQPDEVHRVGSAFERLWAHEQNEVVTQDWIDAYAKSRQPPSRGGAVPEVAAAEDPPVKGATPHEGIQTETLLQLELTRAEGNRAGLVALATGLGKTYLSAFDSRGFARVLFVAHREEILKQALETYRNVRPNARLGLLYGKEKDAKADVLFASVQTLAAPDQLTQFEPDEFDYVVVDEFHHAAAQTYRRILDYFEPRFMLGLTATPERLDGANLLALCEGNLVYECAIPRGIDEGRLSPFRYLGVGDDTEFEDIAWHRYTEERLTDTVATDQRAAHALAKLREHTQGRVRALGFCVTKRHAEFMKANFLANGVDCAAVYSGSDDQRTASLDKLRDGEIEILFCVDMFNEGVDVPAIDTVLMLRPTESTVIWMQQLGRGLRYVEGKTLTVVDLIGNHSIFLQRPKMLAEALGLEVATGQEFTLAALQQAQIPEGVSIEFDLEAKGVLEALRKQAARSKGKAERWYAEFKARSGARPTAGEAEQAGWLKSLSKKSGSWFEFVESQSDLTADEVAVLEARREVLMGLEKLDRTKSYKMLILDALLTDEGFPGVHRKDAVVRRVSRRAERSAALTRDISVDASDLEALRRLLEKDAFGRLAKLGGGGWISNETDALDATALGGVPGAAVRSMMRELNEMVLQAYLTKQNSSVLKLPPMIGDDGQPIDARFETMVEPDGRTAIVFHSRGGTRGSGKERNTEYRKGLVVLLERLKAGGHVISEIEVHSEAVIRKKLSAEERSVRHEGLAFPVALGEVADCSELAGKIGSGAKRVGQAPGAKGGNDTRTLKISLVEREPAGALYRRCIAPTEWKAQARLE